MTAKPGPSPSTGAVSKRLAAAGFHVSVSVNGSHNHERSGEGARTSGARRVGESVSIRWSPAFTDPAGLDDDSYKTNQRRYAAAYAAYLADFYDVRYKDGDTYLSVTQKAAAPRIAKDAPRVKDVMATLDAGGLHTHSSPKIYYAPVGSLVFQRLDCTEVVTTAYDTLTHEQATACARAVLEADGWTVEQYDRVDTIVLRVTAKNPTTAEPEKDTTTVAETAPATTESEAIEGTIAARPGEGARPEHADHPVIRAVVADLLNAGHTPSVVTSDTSDDHTPGFFVGLREHDRVSLWWYTSPERFAFIKDANEGAPFRACYATLKRAGWDVKKGSRVVEINSDAPAAPSPQEIAPEVHEGYVPEDADGNPQVMEAVKILKAEDWNGARWGDPEARGFLVLSDMRGPGVYVSSILNGLETDMDRPGEEEFTEGRLSGYHTALVLAGWTAEIKSSHSVYATPPNPEAAEKQPGDHRYAFQFQTTREGEAGWSDLVGEGFSGVLRSDKSAYRVAARLSTWDGVPHRTPARKIRVCVWELDPEAEVTGISNTHIHDV